MAVQMSQTKDFLQEMVEIFTPNSKQRSFQFIKTSYLLKATKQLEKSTVKNKQNGFKSE